MSKCTPKRTVSPRQQAILDNLFAALRLTDGLDISCYDETFLLRSMEKRRITTGCKTSAEYLEQLLKETAEAEAFSNALHVIYSEFFRDTLAFAQLEKLILPRLLSEKEKSGKAEIRVWSAGCAAGQEAWSIAILLDELVGTENKPVSYRICASDKSEPDLSVARHGVYGIEALQNVRLRHLNSSFVREGDSFTIVPRIKARVDFTCYDLFDVNTICPPSSIFGDFDLVLCCNVLFYYRPEKQQFILDKLQRCLAPGGYLITGETERTIVERSDIFQVIVPPATVFHKIPRTR